jgi:hypothetical protein
MCEVQVADKTYHAVAAVPFPTDIFAYGNILSAVSTVRAFVAR